MADYACLKTLQDMVNNAHKEGLREVKVPVRFLEELNSASMALLINRAVDYEAMQKNKPVNDDEDWILKGGSW